VTLPALKRKLSEIVDEYTEKFDAIESEKSAFEAAGKKVSLATTIGGTYNRTRIDTGSLHAETMKMALLKSAWWHVYNGLNIDTIAPANDKKRFEQLLENPPPFTMTDIKDVFGDYVADPWGNILRGLAEVFAGLDPAYKSHEKVKIGVKGLPKRIIINGVKSFYSSGEDRLRDVLNALAAYQGKSLTERAEIQALIENGDALLNEWDYKDYRGKHIRFPARGVWLKTFQNGNGHLFFEPETLKDINRALAEYYGDVLPDCHEAKPEKKRESTEVSKDLQYYPTPQKVVDRVLDDMYQVKGDKILEPSCGCGRFMDALRDKGAKVFGIEFDQGRANECRAKGHNVLVANFLETIPTQEYDRVVMNPPFYGKHYAKHIKHAMKFLKPGGELRSILPITARYDHDLIEGMGFKHRWHDLPVGSFRESGTNINTTVLTMWQVEK